MECDHEKITMLRFIERFAMPLKREGRYDVHRPFRRKDEGPYVYATNNHVLIRASDRLLPDDIGDDPDAITPSTKFVLDDEILNGMAWGCVVSRDSTAVMLCPMCDGKRRRRQPDKNCRRCHGTGKYLCSCCGSEKTCWDCYFREIECDDCDKNGVYLEKGRPVELAAVSMGEDTRYCRLSHLDLAMAKEGGITKTGFSSDPKIVYFSNDDCSVSIAVISIDRHLVFTPEDAKAKGEG